MRLVLQQQLRAAAIVGSHHACSASHMSLSATEVECLLASTAAVPQHLQHDMSHIGRAAGMMTKVDLSIVEGQGGDVQMLWAVNAPSTIARSSCWQILTGPCCLPMQTICQWTTALS